MIPAGLLSTVVAQEITAADQLISIALNVRQQAVKRVDRLKRKTLILSLTMRCNHGQHALVLMHVQGKHQGLLCSTIELVGLAYNQMPTARTWCMHSRKKESHLAWIATVL